MIVLMKPLHLMGNDAGLVDQECSKTTLHRRDKGCHFHDQTSAKTYVFISTPPNATSKPTLTSAIDQGILQQPKAASKNE
jgi:hypothetical protein